MSLIQDQQIIGLTVKDLMIPGEKVAHVQLNNPLEHALLVLVKSGYSAVPVLDTSYKLTGLISKTLILNHILGLERFEMERLPNIEVQEIMEKEIPSVTEELPFMEALKIVIDHPFVCVADKDGIFDGILTRRAILKRLNRNFYEERQKEKKE